MRRCWLAIFLALWICATMTGCGFFDWFYAKPKNGGSSTAETVQAVAHSFGPIGDLISIGIGAVGTIYGANRHLKHRKTHKDNQKLRALVPSTVPPADLPKA